jgi:hypothetical protein
MTDIRHHFERFKDEDIFIIGAGFSLAGFNFNLLKNRTTIVLNGMINIVPEPAYHLFADKGLANQFYRVPYTGRTHVVCKPEAKNLLFQYKEFTNRDQVLIYEEQRTIDQVKEDDAQLFINNTVATGAVQLAWKLGARRIFLLGCDACYTTDDTGEIIFYCDDRADTSPQKTKTKRKQLKACAGKNIDENLFQDNRHPEWCKQMIEIRQFFVGKNLYNECWPDSGIYNLSAISTIEAFQKVPIQEVF